MTLRADVQGIVGVVAPLVDGGHMEPHMEVRGRARGPRAGGASRGEDRGGAPGLPGEGRGGA
eukprot:9482071-Pyramimonas_sp.AAC.1